MGRNDHIGPRRLPCGLAFAALLFTAACGGDNNSNGDSNTNNDNIPQARAGMRIGWTQAAGSLQQLRSMTFRLYVSGAPATLGAVNCGDTAGSAGYECSGALPTMSAGIQTLQLTSVLQGAESTRSSSLRVNVVTTSLTTSTPQSSDAQTGSSVDGLACTVSGRVCFAPTALVARDLVDPTSLTATPDGRLLFVEAASKIRVVVNQALLQEPALVVPASVRVVGMAVDTDFNTTHVVYVASTDETKGSAVTLNITRYREVANSLGEAATIVAGLPFVADALAPLAVDAAGLVYVAMPSAKADDSGAVLRFTRDGQVPKDNVKASPVIAYGYNRPSGLAIDSVQGQIWLAGNSERWTHGVSTFTLQADPNTTWPRVPHTLGTWVQGERFHTATLGLTRRQGETSRLLITAGRQLYDGSLGEGGRLNSMSEVVFTRDVAIEASASGPGGLLFVLVRNAGGTASVLQMQLKQ